MKVLRAQEFNRSAAQRYIALALATLCACSTTGSETESDGASSDTVANSQASTGSATSAGSEATSAVETATETGTEPAAPLWCATWGAAPTEANAATVAPFTIEDQSLRQVARVSLGGEAVRVRLANTFGETDLQVTAARVALSGEGSAIATQSDHQLTLDGAPSFVVPVGELVVTDPVALELPALSDVSVSLYFADAVMTTTVHAEAKQTSWITAGDLVAAASWPARATTATTSSFWLNGIEVLASEDAATIVAFGDSITDGAGSTLDANKRWTNQLASRLQGDAATAELAVVNAGIGGNCLLRDFIGPRALNRFDRDVLDQPGVSWGIITVGINDIGIGSLLGQPVSAEQLIDGYRDLIERAHARGVLAYGGTLLPFEGADYFSEEGEQVRQAVNAWIRSGGAYDAVIDFDAVTRDPDAPTRLLPAYDAGDGLHPSDAGYAAMAEAIELALFQ